MHGVSTGGVWYQGGYTGWVIRRLYRVPTDYVKRSMFQRSGPRKALQGPGVGGNMHSAPGPRYHPLRCAPGPAPLYLDPPRANPVSWP